MHLAHAVTDDQNRNREAERVEGAIVLGAGPAGLAVGATLGQLGVPARILERSDQVGSSWRSYYEGLRLNSPRRRSSLPGLEIESGCGQWPIRNDMIVYLERYARHHCLDIRFGVDVGQISRQDGQWRVTTTAGDLLAEHVVLASGKNRQPVLPSWPGAHQFQGELLHARDYRNPKPYRGKEVLVVGSGSTGVDVALELVAIGARRVSMAVRTPPLILRPQRLGIPTDSFAQMVKRAPAALHPLFDRFSLAAHARNGDLSEFGLRTPTEGVVSAMTSRGHGATLDRGFVAAVRAREITILPAVEGFDRADVLLADGGRVRPDAVIAATGQRPALEPIVGHLGVLAHDGRPLVHGGECVRRAPQMYFIGYRLPPGQLPDMAPDARKIARRIQATTRLRAA